MLSDGVFEVGRGVARVIVAVRVWQLWFNNFLWCSEKIYLCRRNPPILANQFGTNIIRIMRVSELNFYKNVCRCETILAQLSLPLAAYFF